MKKKKSREKKNCQIIFVNKYVTYEVRIFRIFEFFLRAHGLFENSYLVLYNINVFTSHVRFNKLRDIFYLGLYSVTHNHNRTVFEEMTSWTVFTMHLHFRANIYKANMFGTLL